MLRRNGPAVKSVESVLRLEGSLWWEWFVKEVILVTKRLLRSTIEHRISLISSQIPQMSCS